MGGGGRVYFFIDALEYNWIFYDYGEILLYHIDYIRPWIHNLVGVVFYYKRGGYYKCKEDVGTWCNFWHSWLTEIVAKIVDFCSKTYKCPTPLVSR